MHNHIKHLVIDEMQDYSYLQYVILNQIFKCRMTILGDKAQTLDEQMRDVLQFPSGVFDQKIRKIVMNKSYRNTNGDCQICRKTDWCQRRRTLKTSWKEVVEEQSRQKMQFWMEILSKPNLEKTRHEDCCHYYHDGSRASTLYQILKARGEEVHYIDRNSSVFKRTYRHDLLSCKRSGIRPGIRCVPGCRKLMLNQAKYICNNKVPYMNYICISNLRIEEH